MNIIRFVALLLLAAVWLVIRPADALWLSYGIAAGHMSTVRFAALLLLAKSDL